MSEKNDEKRDKILTDYGIEDEKPWGKSIDFRFLSFGFQHLVHLNQTQSLTLNL